MCLRERERVCAHKWIMFYKHLKNNKQRLLPTACNDEGDDDSDDGDRFDDKTTAVTDDDYDDSDASLVSECV